MDVEKIAAGLSEAQKRCVKTPYRGALRPDIETGRATSATLNALQRLGLTDEVDLLTETGLAVRTHLENSK